jgi:hypothetical protein
MSDETATPEAYEPPAIEARTEVSAPLVGFASVVN